MPTSLEIAQGVELRHMRQFMADLDLTDDEFEFYGKYTGKLRLRTLDLLADRPDGKLILVTAMTPTKYGEGKTLTTIGMGQALAHLGRRGMIALREPSLGPVFGIKGGATGGGYAQVVPMEKINLHFNGDLHAITTAHNLLAAMMDNHILKDNELRIDVTNVLWNRTMDMNDRALRQIVVGLGGRANGVPRESGFVITAASEIMAILALATSRADLKRRLGEIVVGFDLDGQPVRAADLQAHTAMAAVLNEAVMPNLVQTLEHTPALVHAGPFANIAHGTSSVLAARLALKLADYVVTECGFGADLGFEKFIHIVCRQAGLWPAAVVLVVTCRAVKHHGGVPDADIARENLEATRRGLANVEVHVRNVRKLGLPVVVAINRFPYDTPAELSLVRALCDELGVPCEEHEAFTRGGAGTARLAEQAVAAADASESTPRYLYALDQPVEEKVQTLATQFYGADGVYFEKRALKKIERFTRLGYGGLPVCIAKTQSSLSDNPRLLGAPRGWTLTVTDAALSAGAGFLVLICGDMMLMPGLPKVPAAVHIDVDDDGHLRGMF